MAGLPHLAEGTVKKHSSTILQKTGARSHPGRAPGAPRRDPGMSRTPRGPDAEEPRPR
ncbi:hypothetical protein [Brachybacterium sp. P6-10-X1]|uniref:hypothetical protein n=1 Tax=Brachybacterium sp. P6-10-X1 TaxID=1903186 RepID=UPI0020A3E460|nr:hypothetical protein [Brachybacterium sp. P6-10-X1]